MSRRPGWLLALWALAATAAAAGRVHYADGRLSAAFSGVEPKAALEELARATGVEFALVADRLAPLTAQVRDLPLEQGLRRLLAGYNYILLYDTGPDGSRRPARVLVLSEGREAAPPPVPAPGLAGVAEDRVRELVLSRHASGHYVHGGAINGQAVEFLVDTGASAVAVPGRLARRLGLTFGAQRSVLTANGRTLGYETVLERVELGGLAAERVQGVILPQLSGRVLLGMSFLESFEMVQRNDTLTLRRVEPGP